MTALAKHGRYFCEECTQRYDSAGTCPQDEGEPLMDLADEEVRLFIEDQDAARKRKRFAIFAGVGLVPGVPLGLVLLGWEPTSGAFGIPAFASAAAVIFGVATVLTKVFPPPVKMPNLTDQELTAWSK